MTAQRATILIAGAALAMTGAPAAAQVNDGIVLNIMRECAKIDDPTARLSCYDNNIRSAGGNPQSVTGVVAAPLGGASPVSPDAPQGFGSENIRTPQQQSSRPAGNVDEISVRVSGAREREPGIYLVQIDDGTQWLFAQSVGRSYRPPQRGDMVTIERGSLGSYLLQFKDQQLVQVHRVK